MINKLLIIATVLLLNGLFVEVNAQGQIIKTESMLDSHSEKVIVDETNGLMWTYDDYMSANKSSLPNASWYEAVKWKDNLNKSRYGGYNDWRLPTVKELVTLYRPKSQREMSKTRFAPTKAYALWCSNAPNKYVRSYVILDDGAAVSGSPEGNRNAMTGELFNFSVRLVRNM